MVLDGLGIGLGHLGRSGRCFAEGLLEIQVDDDAGSGAFRRRRPKQKAPRNQGTEAGRWIFVPRDPRTIQLDVSRGRWAAVGGEQGARLPDGARPEVVTQCKEDGMHAEAQGSWHNTGREVERGRGSMVPVPMAVVVNGDDARGRGFLLTNAQGLRRGRRDVQSTAQPVPSSWAWAGGQAGTGADGNR